MGHNDGRDPQPLLQQAQLDLHVLAQFGVQCRHRLVQQEHLRLSCQGPRDCHALALPARKLPDAPVAKALQLDKVQKLVGAGHHLGL